MRKMFLAAAVLASLLPAPAARAAVPAHVASPPGQIYVVTINAAQNNVVGTQAFQMLVNLAKALVSRPVAFDGGTERAGSAPDVIVVQEISASNLDILAKLLRQHSDFNYQPTGLMDSRPKFVINTDRVAFDGESVVWDDPCYSTMTTQTHEPPANLPERRYQWNRFVEKETSTPFVVAGVHFAKPAKYAETGEELCVERNVEELRAHLEPVAALPTIIGGDFNRKPTTPQPACDLEELGAPMEWWSMLTAPAAGTAYSDSAQVWTRATGGTMRDQWTHMHRLHHASCGVTYLQHRIDYLFAGNVRIASAVADHPGWAGEVPGTRSDTNPYYSDHRFVSGRYQITGPEPAPRPAATALAGGRISLTWTAPEAPPAGWVLYRATSGKAYNVLARLPGSAVSYDDYATDHGRSYRYALAAVDAVGAQGVESARTWMTADARGPLVTSTTPRPGATGVERRADIYARFDERIAPDSVDASTLELTKNGRKVCARVNHIKPRVVMLDPCNALAKRAEYRVIARVVHDVLGNPGEWESWRFVTR